MIHSPHFRCFSTLWTTSTHFLTTCSLVLLITQLPATASSQKQSDDSLSIRNGQLTAFRNVGSTDTVSSQKLNRIVTANLMQALQGQVAGLLVRSNSGKPGGGATLQIHGPGRFGDTSPLVVVDGMIIGQTDNLNWLAPNAIESVEVLKDAASTGLYGMRGSNGVLLITTKKGTIGKPRVSVDLLTGVQRVNQRPQLLNTRQYIDYINDSRSNGGLIPAFKLTNQVSLDTLLKTNTDWLGALLRPAPVRSAYVSVAGGTESARYLVAADYFKQDGVILGSDFERFSVRLNTDFDLLENLKVGQHLTVSQAVEHANEGTSGRSPIEQAIKSAPYLSITNPKRVGGYEGTTYLDASNDALNPIGLSVLTNDRHTSLNLIGDLFGEWTLFDGLTYRATLGFDLRNFDRAYSMPAFNMGEYNINLTASLARAKQTGYNTLLHHQLSYTRTAGAHSLAVLLAGSRQTYNNNDITAYADGLPGNDIRSLTAGQSSRNRTVGGAYAFYRIVSLMGQLSYDYEKKYWLTAVLRRDGSSRFGPGHRFGAFPSLGAAWSINKEKFLESVPYLTTVKLRAGWGKTGNDNVGDFQYASLIAQNYNYPFGPTNSFLGVGAFPSTLPNPGIRWETTTTSNVGLDVSGFDNRVKLRVDYFRKRTTDLLVEVPLPASVGAAAPLTNAGTVDNSGIDLSLTAERSNEWITFNVTGFASWQKNKVISLGDRPTPVLGGLVQDETVTATMVGEPVGSYNGFQRVGIFQNRDEIIKNPNLTGTEPGDIRYADLNKDGKITDADKTVLGSPVPTFYYGLSASVSSMNFDLSVLLQGVSGNQLYNANAYWLNGYQGRYNAGTEVLSRWTREKPSTTQPRADASSNRNFRPSDRFIEEGGYFRVKSLQLGYTLPETLTSTFGASRLRVYVGAQNLFTKTKYPGFDPEFARNQAMAEGIDFAQQPQSKMFMGGVQINF
ncbi:SusC/RagA family TonB-linked outer membrane protein [Larkinella rosea]|uniref:SusC/RagA family TonB-linked outer membrane protein n=1 Tax=Larkinella rosea TaxID=2025312 RepID=A0A3P1BI42_9BACT|nr:SusC/RagA family TonB-linked outer membrane protein [Larkinella rosea]RRB00731.1 SusC/RagA family TonB-linked outer membrane protein [Larkinella rosea]